MFLNEIYYAVSKDGYYNARHLKHQFLNNPSVRWEPWNPVVTVVLREIGNPIPMYAKRVELKLPELNRPLGYDLIVGDWVDPYGKGMISDFIFEAGREIRGDNDYEGELVLKFSNRGDGIFSADKPVPDGSGLWLPAFAPEDGYAYDRNWRISRRPGPDGRPEVVRTSSKTMNYYFRVRSITDAQGKVLSAFYGKIYGEIGFFLGVKAPTSGLGFTYFLNPDGTRNVEFDPKRNLFGPTSDRDSAFPGLGP